MIDLWHINRIDWLQELSAAEVERLRQASDMLELSPNSTVFEPTNAPEHVYLLESGLVRMYRASSRGDQVTLGYIQPGEVFGELTLFSDAPRQSFAATVEASSIIRSSKERFLEVIRAHAEIVVSITAQIEGRFREIESRVEDLVFRNARSRLANIIAQLAEKFGESNDAEQKVKMRLTHAELATLAGTSRPTISIAIGEFEDEGIISRQDGYILIANPAALMDEANRTG